MCRLVQRLVCLCLLSPLVVLAQDGDIAGASDYPALGRYKGSVITGYESQDFDEYVFFTGPVKGRNDRSHSEKLEGKLKLIAYRAAAKTSLADVYRNFRQRLEGKGFNIIYSCSVRECGGADLAYAIKKLPLPKMEVDPFNYRYLAARKVSEGQQVSITLIISADTKKQARIQVTVLESGELENKMVDAEKMAAELGKSGHIALYGIYFDTDKDVVKPESRPTLEQIAKLLKVQPKLRVILVGHTDNQGGYEYNMQLSARRAQAVAKALTTGFGIVADRLHPAGVGYLAPVASNASEAGRALNRRVELVQGN